MLRRRSFRVEMNGGMMKCDLESILLFFRLQSTETGEVEMGIWEKDLTGRNFYSRMAID